ncbi:MAG: hypothetical protein IJ064_03000 [Bacteroidaceae bacterium]|nr:hypothetical protein [Bacteroidaceae bacterium]
MKRQFVNVILAICAVGMLYICYHSIADQQDFEAEVKQREADVKARLMEIKDAENAYKEQHGEFCGNWDSLIVFIKEGKLPTVVKQGILTEAQMEKGLTEAKAAAIVNSGNQAEIAANGLQGFRRDTTWVSLIDSLYYNNPERIKYYKNKNSKFNPDEIRYIPYSDVKDGQKKEFELIATQGKTKSDIWIPVMECSAEFETYLSGNSKLWAREAANQREKAEGLNNFPGLCIGKASGSDWNNNAGNWE